MRMSMNPAKTVTPVMFRVWQRGGLSAGVIAIFPTEPGTMDPYTCMMYEHVGQHGSGDPVGVIQQTRQAKASEYADLFDELRQIGYGDMVVYKRYQHSWVDVRRRKLQQMNKTNPIANPTEWIIIGNTSYASDPEGLRRSFNVYTGSKGMAHYYVFAPYTRHDKSKGGTYYAKPAAYTGFEVTTRVPRGKVPAGLVNTILMDLARGMANPRGKPDICDNASTRGGIIGIPQCFNNRATKTVTIVYSESPFGTDSNNLLLCDECAKKVSADAKRHGYTVR